MKNELLIWNEKLLYALDLDSHKHSIHAIELALKKKYFSKGYIVLTNSIYKVLQIPGYNNRKYRLSYIMSWICKNFIVDNERPKTKFFSSDCDFTYLDNKELSNILKTL